MTSTVADKPIPIWIQRPCKENPPSEEPSPKEICRSSRTEKKARQKGNLENVSKYLNSWLQPDEYPFTFEIVDDFIHCIRQLLQCATINYKKNARFLMFPTVVYADKFVKMRGPIKQRHVLELLVISGMVAIKMYNDSGADMEMISFLTGISKKDLTTMERNFLASIEFSLFLNPEDLDSNIFGDLQINDKRDE